MARSSTSPQLTNGERERVIVELIAGKSMRAVAQELQHMGRLSLEVRINDRRRVGERMRIVAGSGGPPAMHGVSALGWHCCRSH